MNIEGQHAAITGGGTGIGRAIALALADKGAKVSLLGRRLEPLETVSSEIGKAAFVTTCDVTDPEQVDRAFAEARAHHGPIAILVNNAGAASTAPFTRLDAEGWRASMAVNCDAVFHCSKAAIGPMLEAGAGRILTLASVAGLHGVAYASAYSAAKHGAVGLMRSLALEVEGKGVTANAVCPGFVETDMFARSVETITARTGRSADEARRSLAQMNPSGRVITPAEVARSVVQLVQSDRNGEIVEIA